MKSLTFVIVLFVILTTFTSINVEADSTVIFTSTNDFDAGNKSDPGQDYFVSNSVDQPTYSFISKPSAIYSSVVDRTYIAYQGGTNFLPYIVYYSHSSRQWVSPVQVNDTNPVSGDGHGAPSLWIDSSGYIYVFYGAHATRMQLKRSTNPYDISSWVLLNSPTPGTPPSNQATYPHLFEFSGYIYFFYRQGTSVGGDWGFKRSNDRGVTWSTFTNILDFGGDGAYISDTIFIPSQNRVYYSFVWDNRGGDGKRHNAYVCYWDLITNTQYGINGANLGSQVTLSEANNNCRAKYTGDTSVVWFVTMKLDSSYRPYLIYTNTSNDPSIYNITFVRWTGSSWTDEVTITTTDGTSSYADMIIYGTNDIDAFIITEGFSQLSGNDDYSGSLERWHWNGSTWSFMETIMSEAKSGNPVNRPFVPLNYDSEIKIVFDSWNPKYPLSPEVKMWAWGDSGLVRRTEIESGTYGLETNTDNPKISSGTFSLSNARYENFNRADSDANTFEWTTFTTGDGTGTLTSVFSGGVYNVTVVNPGGSGRHGKTLSGTFGITGNWDVRTKFTVTDYPTDTVSGLIYTLCLFTQPDECDTVSGTPYYYTRGLIYRYFAFSNGNPLGMYDAFYQTENGVLNTIGSSTFSITNPNWLRITKSGTTFTFYRSIDGNSWIQDEQSVIPSFTDSVWYYHITPYSNGVNDGNTWSIIADDYNLESGGLDSNGYRKLACWVSPIQSSTSEIVSSIMVNYSGASANTYIDSIYLYGVSRILYSNTDNIISGTSRTYNTNINPFQVGQNWYLKLCIAGDGLSSIVINNIEVQTISSTFTTNLNASVYITGFLSLCVLFIIASFKLRKYRGGVL